MRCVMYYERHLDEVMILNIACDYAARLNDKAVNTHTRAIENTI